LRDRSKIGIRRHLARAAAAAYLAILAAGVAVPVLADQTADEHHGGDAPEASWVLLLPAVGGIAIGARALLSRRSRR
jgi:hypothetical protein